ncbi:MAG: SMI1/KNR4 family protein [Erysipelotrichaceae bacterium]|uniref:SMI1/KNR4 family protein n=1 Tax=Clostridium sp. TaxID=1506 RepID=UPI00302AA51A
MKIELYEENEAIKIEKIKQLENEMQINLPLEYIDFMLEQNGGYPKISEFDLPDGSNSSIVNYFYPIGKIKGNLKDKNDIFDGEITDDFITIGCDSAGNQILLRIRGEYCGELYFWDHDVDPEEENNMHFLAKSLYEFLKMLK